MNDTQSYAITNFAATHNSYSGDISGSRGTIDAQLSSGVRFIEFDINLGDYSSNHDYQIGHGRPGYQVEHTAPNPSSNNLADWLQMVASWSDQNPSHAPITLAIDSKDDLSSQSSPSEGNPSALNSEIVRYFGNRLFTAADLGSAAWPTLGSLQGKILVVLSGNQTNREHYRSDQGLTPAVAINASGVAIAVYQSSQSSHLWYWYGQADEKGAIAWNIHGKYDSGITPAVAISASGLIVEVHRSQTTSELYSHVGKLENGQVKWGGSQKLNASGNLPSVAFSSGDTIVEEIHLASNGQTTMVTGTVNADSLTIEWSSAVVTSQSRFPTASSSAGAYSVSISAGKDSAGIPNTLLYSTPNVRNLRVVYPQVMFTEFQNGDSEQLANDNLWFYASSSSSGNWSWAESSRNAGKIVRLWDFKSSDTTIATPPNFAATNTPDDAWYQSYCQQNNCQQ